MNTPSRWTSRKFLTTLAAQITSILILLWPAHGSEIGQVGTSVAALAVLLLSTLGYVATEGAIDKDNKPADAP